MLLVVVAGRSAQLVSHHQGVHAAEGLLMPTPLLLMSLLLPLPWEGAHLPGTERDSPGAQVPTLPRAGLNSYDGFSPVSLNVFLLRHLPTYLEDSLWSAPRDTTAIFLFALGMANF